MTEDDIIWQAYPLPEPKLEPVTALVENCTIAELVKSYRKLDAEIDELVEQHKKELSPKKKDLDLIIGALTILLDKAGQTNATTEYGSARFYTKTKIKVVDRLGYLNWVMDNRAIDVITSAVSNDAVKDRQKRGDALPAGLEISLERNLSVWKP